MDLTYVILIFDVGPVHHLQQLDLDLCLVQERLLVLDDLDGNVALFVVIERLHHLTKRALPYQRVYLVSVQELFTIFYDVIVVVVVVTVVIQLSFLLMRSVVALHLCGSPLLLRIINLCKKII